MDKNNLCSCGCGYEIGSEKFQDLHVNQEDEAQREVSEQIEAERQAMEDDYRNQEEDAHHPLCFCVRCDG